MSNSKALKFRRATRLVGAFAVGCLWLCGCANLAAVREFAKTSAATADYKQVVADYTNSPTRQLRYQPDRNADTLKQLATKRAAQGPMLEATQQVLVAYMSSLGDLAADKLPNVDSEIDGLSKALETAKFVGDGDQQIGKETATAAASIAKVLIRAGLDGWRQREVVKIVKETNAPLQDVVAGLKEILDKDLRMSLQNEEIAVSKPFQSWNAAAKAGNDPDGAPQVARILLDERLEQVKAKRASLDAYIKVLDTIAKGHDDLFKNVDKFDKKDLVERLKGYSKDLQTLYKSVKKISN